jgi:hypothetical protein
MKGFLAENRCGVPMFGLCASLPDAQNALALVKSGLSPDLMAPIF